jgi:hypothetical protein
MDNLKPCPFCGGGASLCRKKTHSTEKTDNSGQYGTAINDYWAVECNKGCCCTPLYPDFIYHSKNGIVIIERDGAQEAVDFWNNRPTEGKPNV